MVSRTVLLVKFIISQMSRCAIIFIINCVNLMIGFWEKNDIILYFVNLVIGK